MGKIIKQEYKLEHMLIFENTQELILLFDMTGRILECNRKAREELDYGASIYKIPIYEIFKDAFLYVNKKLTINENFLNKADETATYRKNQTCFPAVAKIAILSDKKKTIGICSAINISERKEAARTTKLVSRELEEYQQAKNEFVANITHELRTPVNGIAGLSDNLLEMELTPKQLETVKMIKRCCNGMNTLINDLLDYTKISNNKLTMEEREFSFYDFIRQVVEFNKSKITGKGLKLLVNISNDIPDRVIGDEFRLGQVLNNLFSNASKFTTVGQIALEVVKLSKSDRYIELFFMLIDTGIGIGVEDKERIFQSFSQEDGSISRRFGGTGLGLAISKSLVEAMHGTITVDSIKNKGSNFSFSVRLALPNTSSGSEVSEKGKATETAYDSIFHNPDFAKEVSRQEEHEFMGQRLSEALYTNRNQKQDNQAFEDDQKAIIKVLEKLSLCIEMDNWETAEELAGELKNNTKRSEIKKEVFRLLLAVRKESHDSSLEIINEIRSILDEVK